MSNNPLEHSSPPSHRGTVFARGWLIINLRAGPMPVEDLRKKAAALGVRRSTLDTAKKGLAIDAVKREDGVWLWALPSVVVGLFPDIQRRARQVRHDAMGGAACGPSGAA